METKNSTPVSTLAIRHVQRYFGDLSFIPTLVKLALPIALQHLLMTVLNLADTLMVGQLGEVQIGAIALGNQIFFLLMLFLFGVGSGSAVFASQYWGRRDVAGVRRAMGVSLLTGSAGALVFTALGVFAPELLLSVFTSDPAVISEGAGYLRIVALSYLVTSISMGYVHALRSVGDTRLPLIATAISITLNVAGNYVLIFGALGFPALGVQGAGIATAIARVVELSLILFVVYRRKGPTAATLSDLLRFDWTFARRFYGRAMPVIFNEILWSLGFTMYTVVFARMGTSHLAAYTISDTVGRLLLVLFIGSAQASAILLGNVIGEGSGNAERSANHELGRGVNTGIASAQHIGTSLIKILPVASALLGLVVFTAVAPWVPSFFEVSDEVRRMVTLLVRSFAVVMVAKILNMHIVVGILRGGGDTRVALLVDVGFLWMVGVPAAFIAGLVFQLPVHIVYLCIGLEEAAKLAVGVPRILSGRWVNDLTASDDALHAIIPDASDASGFPL